MSEWQPIETAPRDGAKILLFCDGVMSVALWRRQDWVTAWDYDSLTQYNDEPTHWQPLPPPPTTEAMER